MADKPKGKRHHPYSHTTVHHFKDGSGHTTHHHEEDPKKNVEYAHLDHDGMMDGMHSNLSPEMAGGGAGAGGGEEEAMEAGAAGGAPGGGAV